MLLPPEELAAVQVLAKHAATCGCRCHTGQPCPFAEYIGNNICIPILAERLLKYAAF